MNTSLNPIPLSTDDRMAQIEREMLETRNALQTQSGQIAEILQLLKQPAAMGIEASPTGRTDSPTPDPITSFVSRRSMLKQAAMATLGAAAVLETMPSARAGGTNGTALLLGESNMATASTSISTSSGIGVEGASSTTSGVYGVCTATSLSSKYIGGVTGNSVAGPGVVGLSGGGNGNNPGVVGMSGTAYGLVGISNSGSGLYAKCTTTSTASGYIPAISAISNSGAGLSATGATFGALLNGDVAALYLASNMLVDPNTGTVEHFAGELYVDSSGGLWYCVATGTPGTWRQVARSATAGSFTMLPAPTRFIDTRPSSASYTPDTASFIPNYTQAFTFSGLGALLPYTPQGTTAPVIPYGATGLVGRMTVLSGESGSSVGGELKVSNVYPPGFGSGLVVWKTAPATQIVPFVLGLDNTSTSGRGNMYFQNTSTADTIDLIVDVTGYYY